jgi:transposase-like protein
MYDLKAEIAELVRARIRQALEVGGTKAAAADLLGLGSYQTLSNWMSRYGVADITPARRELVRERFKIQRAECFEVARSSEPTEPNI